MSLEFCWSLGLRFSLEFRYLFCLFLSLLFDELHTYEVDVYFPFFSISFARFPLNSFLFAGPFSQNYGRRLFPPHNFVPSLLLPLAISSSILLSLMLFPRVSFFLLCDSQTVGSFLMSRQLTVGNPKGILFP